VAGSDNVAALITTVKCFIWHAHLLIIFSEIRVCQQKLVSQQHASLLIQLIQYLDFLKQNDDTWAKE